MWEKFKELSDKAKLIIGTITLLVTTITGGYTIMSHFFVPKAYADKLVSDVKKELNALNKIATTNSDIILEMRMIRLESKMVNDIELTPTEKRMYEKLKEEYKKRNQ